MKMVNPLSLDTDVETYGYRYYFATLVGFATLSVAGNVLYGVAPTVPPWVVAVSHGAPPLVFALMVHLGAVMANSFGGAMRRPGPRPEHGERHVDWSSVIVVVPLVLAVTAVAAIALYVSFEGLTGLAATMGWGAYSWTLPLLLDIPAGVATLGVLLATHAMRSDEHAVDGADRQSVTAPRTTLVTDQGDHVADRPVAVVTDHTDQSVNDQLTNPVTTATDQAVTTPVVLVTDQVDHPVTSRADRAVTTATNRGDHAPVTAAELVESVVSDRPTAVTDHRDHDGDRVVTDRVTTLDGPVTDHDDQVVTDHTVTTAGEEATEPVTDHQVTDPLDIRSVAERVRETKDLDVAVDVLTEALGLLADGVSRRKVAEAVNVGSHNTVKRWADAAADLDPAYAAAIGRPRGSGLVAVG